MLAAGRHNNNSYNYNSNSNNSKESSSDNMKNSWRWTARRA
mgnify:CR=1 FL=1